MKLLKPIFPARDLGYSPTYKNSYKEQAFSVIGQKFADDNVCIKDGILVPKYGATCPTGYVSIYQSMGLKGHNGIDIACAYNTPVFSAHAGKVIKICEKPSYGLGITIQAENGELTIYWHLSKTLVLVGQKVRELEKIGLGDSTGNSTGHHLHFGLYNEPADNGYGGATDPLPLIEENYEYEFNSYLYLGKSGEEVRNLQIRLAYEGFLGQVGFAGFTGYFGLQTNDALIRYQIKEGIINSKWSFGAGYCGPKTRKKLNEQ